MVAETFAYVLIITVAILLTHDRAFLCSRSSIFIKFWQHSVGCKDEADADRTIAAFHRSFDFFRVGDSLVILSL